jgi:hypothetical protein
VANVATYHLSIKTGGKGRAVDHADYIAREGRFADVEKYGAIEAQGQGNIPDWARGRPRAFWAASDQFERENGNTYREFELALPRELTREHQIALVQRFIESELGNRHAYQWALHMERASDGGEQPHVHLMFSDRMLDGIERGPEQYFKRANRKNPEKGGNLKKSYGANKAAAAETYKKIRARWGAVQNLALEAHGIAARVDHRSLAEQGIRDREPGLHQGPAVAGIEARGEVSEVGQRQRQQIAERQAERGAAYGWVLEEDRQVARGIDSAERVAARERRELLPVAGEAPQEDQAELARQLARDRRTQLERAAAVAARRTLRREHALSQAAPAQLPLFTRLVSQAQALKARIGVAMGHIKDWVRERFQKAERAANMPPERAQAPAQTPRPTLEEIRAEGRAQWLQERAVAQERGAAMTLEELRRQGREDWLKLRAEQTRVAALSPEARAEAQAAAARAALAERLTEMVGKRAAQDSGWSDRGDAWQACSPKLQKLITGLVQAGGQQAARQVLEVALEKPGVVERLQREIGEYQKTLANDRGLGR